MRPWCSRPRSGAAGRRSGRWRRWGMSRRSYYRAARRRRSGRGGSPEPPAQPVQPYEALPEERAAVSAYALAHPELRHRELAWRMVDEDVVVSESLDGVPDSEGSEAGVSVATADEASAEEEEKATRPNERWATDLMQVRWRAVTYYLVSFMDEYSRYVVHHELLTGMDGGRG